MGKNRRQAFIKAVIGCGIFLLMLLSAGNVFAAESCTVSFNNNWGTSSSTVYKRLEKVVAKNTVITLPELSNITGYTNEGWTTEKGKSTPLYQFGEKVRIKEDTCFYLVRKKIPSYKVTFNNNSGTSKSSFYTKLNQTVLKGTAIELPTVAAPKGYVNLGWTTAKGKSTPLYKEGSSFTVTKATSFYIVRKRLYTVKFLDMDGSSDTAFEDLNVTQMKGTVISLPTAYAKDGYSSIGWSTKKNAATVMYRNGESFTISQNTTLYAVYRANVTVSYYDNSGSRCLKEVAVGKGGTLRLSGMKSESGYTFLGWSTSPRQKLSPKYEVGKTIVITGNLKLYAVVYDKSQEYDITASTLPRVDASKYTKIIFVGDSRTVRMSQTLGTEFSASLLKRVVFLGRSGSGVSWIKGAGYRALMAEVGDGGTEEKPIAIVFNSGVNDTANVSSYIAFMNKIAARLKKRNCELYYMSVNPVNSAVLTARGITKINESSVRSFNQKIKDGICSNGNYKYIDVYSYLMKKGFGFDKGRGTDTGIDDGLHFTTKTYKKIYSYVINTLNKV